MAIEYTPQETSNLVNKISEGGAFQTGSSQELSTAKSFASEAVAAKIAAELAEANAQSSETASASSASASASSASSSATSATAAASSASAAATSETAAELAETNAETAETSAISSASLASTSETNASTSATAAATSATNAATSLANIGTSETNAATSATDAAASYDSFDDRYLGPKASAPTLDNDGDVLLTGALYFNTTVSGMFVYTDADTWVNAGSTISGVEDSVEYIATAGQTVFAATYDNGFVQVYLNGLRLLASDYTANNNISITLHEAAALDDEVFIQSFGAFVLADHYSKVESDVITDALEAQLSTIGSEAIVHVTSASQLSGTLLSNKVYFLEGAIDLGSVSIVVPTGGVTLAGHGFGISGLVSTEDNHTMFINDGANAAGDVYLTSMDVTSSGVGSKVFDLDNQGNSNAVEWNTVNFLSCTSLGELKNYRQGLGRNIAWISCTDGLTMTGTWSGGWAIIDSIYVGAPFAGTIFKAGTALTLGGSFRSNVNILGMGASGGVFCDFAPANILLDAGFHLDGVRAINNSGAVPNMPSSSTKALIKNCVGIDNTYQGGAHTPLASSAITVTTVDTLYQITGGVTLEHAHWFSTANTNGLRLDSAHATQVIASGTLSFSGSNGKVMGVQLRQYDDSAASYVNVGPEYQATLNGGGGGLKAEGVTFSAVLEMNENDRVEVWVVNRSDATDITMLVGGQFQVVER